MKRANRENIARPDGTIAVDLGKGRFSIVDACDLSLVNERAWHLIKSKYTCYAGTSRKKSAGGHHVSLHRLILDAPRDLQVDHINGDGLDNRRCNLRLCTTAQNQMNRRIKSGKGKYVGVNKYGKKWRAQIWLNNANTHLGYFFTEDEAGEAYNRAAEIHFGEFARLNVTPLTKATAKSE